jgi:hypothetical protein
MVNYSRLLLVKPAPTATFPGNPFYQLPITNALKFTDRGSVALKVGLRDSSPDELEIVQHEADGDCPSSGLNHSQKIRFQCC